VPDGAGGYKTLNVTLAAGQDLRVSPLGELLDKAQVYSYPNPARNTVNFRIKSEQSPVTKYLAVFDITGRLVKEFREGDFADCSVAATCQPGKTDGFEVRWEIPAGVASGVYIYSAQVRFDATGEQEKVVKKFAIVR